MLTLILAIFAGSVAVAQNADEVSRLVLSDKDVSAMLAKAESLRKSDPETSLALANDVLHATEDSKQRFWLARSHSWIARLKKDAKLLDEANFHFRRAASLYGVLKEDEYQIMDSMEIGKSLLEQKLYEQGNTQLDRALELAYNFGEPFPISKVLEAKAKGLYKQKRYQDSVDTFIETAKYLDIDDRDSQKRLGKAYHHIAQSFKKLKAYEESAEYHKKALSVYERLGDTQLVARSLKNVVHAEQKLKRYVAAIDYLSEAIKLHESLHQPKEQAELLMLGGMIYRYVYRYETSLNYMNRAQAMYIALNNVPKIAETSVHIGYLYTRLEKYEQARSFYQTAIDLPLDQVSPAILASAHREIAVIDLEAGNFQVALGSAEKAHQYFTSASVADPVKSTVTARILGNIYTGLGRADEALRYQRDSLRYAENADSDTLLVKALNGLGIGLVGVDNDEAIAVLKRSLEVASRSNLQSAKGATFNALKDAYKMKGKLEEALAYAESYAAAKTLYFEEQEQKKLVFAKARLDSHKAERELDMLRKKVKLDQLELDKKSHQIEIVKQANQISELELAKKRYANLLLVTSLIVTIGAALYIFKIFVASRKQNRELDFLATHDSLTDCYNRRALFDFLNRDFSCAETLRDYCIIMADVDKFKQINDTFGHATGDKVLRGIAAIFQRGLRRSDIVARYGGEEFCVVLPGAELKHALQIAESMRSNIEKSSIDGVNVTCSFGVSTIWQGATSPEELLAQADKALYQSKHEGRNKVSASKATAV